MKIAYFDPFAGASGDMTLGALVDAGVSPRRLRQELASLPIGKWSLSTRKVERHGLAATKATVRDRGHDHAHRHLADILHILDQSKLPPEDCERAAAVFRRLAEAEARVHRCTVEEIHFHEVGAIDSIVDIVGAVVGLRLLGIDRVVSGPIRTGTGTIDCAHGRLPVPAPATAALLEGFPSVGTDIVGECTTPTGAALLTTLADSFGPRPAMTVESVGYGAGGRHGKTVPNLLRLFVGQAVDAAESDEVVVLEANLDDLSAEITGHVMDRLFEAGALDAWLTPAHMKKNRSGVVLSVLARPDAAPALEALILTETTTFGVRRTRMARRKLEREWVTVKTKLGAVRIKIGRLAGRQVQAAPEYEDCRRIADRRNIPIKTVYAAALAAFRKS
ncbi:nickel pincer cofactor biosynthesis protein LarC [bacterium]|nr:nickel pincer cofactor biosynthesis protein LarC [bacterium]